MNEPSFGAVIGENVRRLRRERKLTQHELCHQWRKIGFHWARSKLAALENGHRTKVTGADLTLMALGLGVSRQDLFVGDGDVRLTEAAVMSRAEIRRVWA